MKFFGFSKWGPAVMAAAACGFSFLAAGCGGGDGDAAGKAGGDSHGDEHHEAVSPKSVDEAVAQVKAAVAAVAAAEGKEARDAAAFRAEAEIEAVATYLNESEVGKISKLANQARCRGAVQNLKLLGKKMHTLAHEGANEELLGNVGKLIEAEIGKIEGYLEK